MGSGASKDEKPEKIQEDIIEEETQDEVDNYEDLYVNQKEEKLDDVPLDAFPSLQNQRIWQAKYSRPEIDQETGRPLSREKYDEQTGRLLPSFDVYDGTWVQELTEREIKIEVDETFLTSSIDSLAAKLTEEYKKDSEKVYAIYRWMKDTESSVPSVNSDHAAYYFAKSHKEPIALLELFQKLCKVCGIDCEIIRGFAKGATFAKKLGDPSVKFREPNHHWLAVAIEKVWYLVDLSWCLQQNTDFYFLCEPAIFVYNHLPQESQTDWQLLYRKITVKEFRDFAFVHKAFYHHELELISHQTSVTRSLSGEEVVSLRYSDERIWSYKLTCEKIGSNVTTVAGVPLEKCVMVEAFEGRVRFNIRFPSSDKYRIDLFCKDPDFTTTPPSLVVSYIFEVQKPLENFVNFPGLDTVLWGPTKHTLTTGLLPKSHTRGRIFVEESTQIKFDTKKEQYLVCTLQTEQEIDFDLEQCVIDSYNPDTQEVSVNVLLPKTGLYTLKIYLEPENQNAENIYVISYLLECIKPFSKRLVFQNYGDKLGVQSMKKVLMEAIKTKNLQKLRASVAIMRANKMKDKMAEEAALAETLLVEMEKINELAQAIEQTDRGTMTEMRNYAKPPQAVHDVLIAALLLLGESEDLTKIWTDVQSRCGNIGKMSLSRRIRMFNILYVHHEIAKRALEILDRHDINVLQSVCPGAALFYSWAYEVSCDVLNKMDHKLVIEPATVKRQKEIFSMIAKGAWPVVETFSIPEVTA